MFRTGGSNRTRRWLPLALLGVMLAVYLPTASATQTNWDAYASSLSAWRIADTGEPWMEGVAFNQLATTGDPTVWQNEINGHLVTARMYGPILAAVPLYWVNSYGDEAAFTIYRGGMTAAVFVAAAVVLLFLSFRQSAGDGMALFGATVFGLATPAWSVGANALWTHPMTMFGLAGAAFAASRERWWLVGAFIGIGMFARPHIAIVAAVLGLGLAWTRRRPLIALAVAVPTGLSLVLLGSWNSYVFGLWHPLGAYASKKLGTVDQHFAAEMSQVENVAGFLVSPDRGFLVWTPIVLVALPAVVRSWRQLPDWSRWLATGGLAYTVLQLALNYFGGSDAFYGYRHALELLVCITPAYVMSTGRLGAAALRVAPVVVALQFAMIVPGAVVEGFYVHALDVWRDNSYWLAVRSFPEIFVPFTMLCFLIGLRASQDVVRRALEEQTETVDDPVGLSA